MNLNIKMFGDIHYYNKMNEAILNKISEKVINDNTDYVFCVGDLIHYNSFLLKYPEKSEMLLKWAEQIANKAPFIMIYGNHDIFNQINGKWVPNYDEGFWNELNTIKNMHLLSNIPYYKDQRIFALSVNPSYEYYENGTKKEDKKKYLEIIRENLLLMNNLDPNKLNIFLSHSPVYVDDPEVLQYIKEFNLVLSGHMHNGLVPPIIDKIFPKNRGLISPLGQIYPNNARGIKNIKYGERLINLVITGGITKLALPNSPLGKLNILFPKCMENIDYNLETKDVKVKTLHL